MFRFIKRSFIFVLYLVIIFYNLQIILDVQVKAYLEQGGYYSASKHLTQMFAKVCQLLYFLYICQLLLAYTFVSLPLMYTFQLLFLPHIPVHLLTSVCLLCTLYICHLLFASYRYIFQLLNFLYICQLMLDS